MECKVTKKQQINKGDWRIDKNKKIGAGADLLTSVFILCAAVKSSDYIHISFI